MQRRQFDRRGGRSRRIAALAPLLGLTDFRIPRDGGQATLEQRARAAREKIELD
jgi:hypothetical protein